MGTNKLRTIEEIANHFRQSYHPNPAKSYQVGKIIRVPIRFFEHFTTGEFIKDGQLKDKEAEMLFLALEYSTNPFYG